EPRIRLKSRRDEGDDDGHQDRIDADHDVGLAVGDLAQIDVIPVGRPEHRLDSSRRGLLVHWRWERLGVLQKKRQSLLYFFDVVLPFLTVALPGAIRLELGSSQKIELLPRPFLFGVSSTLLRFKFLSKTFGVQEELLSLSDVHQIRIVEDLLRRRCRFVFGIGRKDEPFDFTDLMVGDPFSGKEIPGNLSTAFFVTGGTVYESGIVEPCGESDQEKVFVL